MVINKNYKAKNMKPVLLNAIAFLLIVTGIVSCKKDDSSASGKGLPPEITNVTDLNNRAIALTAADYGDWIIIKGKHLATTFKVDFNTVLAADSLIYANDTSVTVKIPPVLPDPENNPITVTTKYGTATYNFRILQPPPVISSFTPGAGPSGQEVTIYGNYFGGVTTVKFDATTAAIVSNSKEEIKVTVPAGVTYGYIYVTTPSGTVKSANVYGFRYLIYDDVLTPAWSSTSWAGTTLITNNTPVRRGTASVKQNYNGWGGFRFTKAAPAVNITGYSGVKFSMYASATSLNKKIKVYLNASSGTGYTMTITKTGQWIDVQVPLTNLGNLTTLSAFVIQEFSGGVQEVFYDDIGLY
jgi:hypothetical protein